jgi:hypothetical protein
VASGGEGDEVVAMKCVLDLSDGEPSDTFDLPDPGVLCNDGDDVVLQLREVEVRLTLQQLLTLHSAIGRWVFRDSRGEEGLQADYCDALEHEKLRGILRAIDDGEIRGRRVPDDLRYAIRDAVTAACAEAGGDDPQAPLRARRPRRRTGRAAEAEGAEGTRAVTLASRPRDRTFGRPCTRSHLAPAPHRVHHDGVVEAARRRSHTGASPAMRPLVVIVLASFGLAGLVGCASAADPTPGTEARDPLVVGAEGPVAPPQGPTPLPLAGADGGIPNDCPSSPVAPGTSDNCTSDGMIKVYCGPGGMQSDTGYGYTCEGGGAPPGITGCTLIFDPGVDGGSVRTYCPEARCTRWTPGDHVCGTGNVNDPGPRPNAWACPDPRYVPGVLPPGNCATPLPGNEVTWSAGPPAYSEGTIFCCQ